MENRYNVFLDRNDVRMRLILSGLDKGIYKIKQHQLSRENGSAYDKWIEMGAPQQLNSEEINYLSNSSIPKQHISEVRIEENFVVGTTLKPHEVQLYEIIPQRTL